MVDNLVYGFIVRAFENSADLLVFFLEQRDCRGVYLQFVKGFAAFCDCLFNCELELFVQVEVRDQAPHGQVNVVEILLEQVLVLLVGNVPLDLFAQFVQTSFFVVEHVHNLEFEQLKFLKLDNQRITCLLKMILKVHSFFHQFMNFLIKLSSLNELGLMG